MSFGYIFEMCLAAKDSLKRICFVKFLKIVHQTSGLCTKTAMEWIRIKHKGKLCSYLHKNTTDFSAVMQHENVKYPIHMSSNDPITKYYLITWPSWHSTSEISSLLEYVLILLIVWNPRILLFYCILLIKYCFDIIGWNLFTESNINPLCIFAWINQFISIVSILNKFSTKF